MNLLKIWEALSILGLHKQMKIVCMKKANLGDACYRSVQNLLSSCLPTQNMILMKNSSVVLTDVLYRCEIRYLIIRKEHRLRVPEKWVSGKSFGYKWQKVTGDWRNSTVRRVGHILFIKYNSGHQSRRMNWVGHDTRGGEEIWELVFGETTWRKDVILKT